MSFEKNELVQGKIKNAISQNELTFLEAIAVLEKVKSNLQKDALNQLVK